MNSTADFCTLSLIMDLRCKSNLIIHSWDAAYIHSRKHSIITALKSFLLAKQIMKDVIFGPEHAYGFLFFVAILFAGFNEKGLTRLTFLLCISVFLAHFSGSAAVFFPGRWLFVLGQSQISKSFSQFHTFFFFN